MAELKLSRRERQKIRNRDEILEVALDLFAEKGFHNVSMHEIANQADFAIGTLYSVFENKEELYKAILLELSRKFQDERSAALAEGGDEITQIRNCLEAKGRVFMNNLKAIDLYYAETRGASYNVRIGMPAEVRQSYESYLQRLAGIFERGIKRGLFHALDPNDLAVAIDSLANTALYLVRADEKQGPYTKKVEAMMRIFFGPVLRDSGGVNGEGSAGMSETEPGGSAV